MTKFILHGGATSKAVERNREFYREIAKTLKDFDKVLLVYFAGDKGKWRQLLEDDQQKFAAAQPDKDLEFILAHEDPRALREQIRAAAAIYMRGGENVLQLINTLARVKNLADLIEGKVVAGSSAGAYAISKYAYFSQGIIAGLDLAHVKVVCHYDSSKSDRAEELDQYKEKLKVYKIPEADFVVLEN